MQLIQVTKARCVEDLIFRRANKDDICLHDESSDEECSKRSKGQSSSRNIKQRNSEQWLLNDNNLLNLKQLVDQWTASVSEDKYIFEVKSI